MNKPVCLIIAFLAGFLVNNFINTICKQNMYEGVPETSPSFEEIKDKMQDYITNDGCIGGSEGGKDKENGECRVSIDALMADPSRREATLTGLAARNECLKSVTHKYFDYLRCDNAIKTAAAPHVGMLKRPYGTIPPLTDKQRDLQIVSLSNIYIPAKGSDMIPRNEKGWINMLPNFINSENGGKIPLKTGESKHMKKMIVDALF